MKKRWKFNGNRGQQIQHVLKVCITMGREKNVYLELFTSWNRISFWKYLQKIFLKNCKNIHKKMCALFFISVNLKSTQVSKKGQHIHSIGYYAIMMREIIYYNIKMWILSVTSYELKKVRIQNFTDSFMYLYQKYKCIYMNILLIPSVFY